ncbi:MAG TPA: glycosyltransferase [Frankiaceae bacterium]|jgi:GT2 family glycosyltransferase|nr:glycosyltransferase [Frankiaceae bacterium]
MTAAVVVPVRGGDRRTARNLRALTSAARAAGVRPYVVDNGAARVVRASLGPGVTVVPCATPGSYAARNAGVDAALSEGCDVVLFTDSDCRPLHDWPAHLLDVCSRHDVVTSVAPPTGRSALARGARADYLARLSAWSGREPRCEEPLGTVDTRACAVRAEVLAAVRFDERLRHAGDAVFGRTARDAGYSVVGCHHACLAHDPPRSWLGEYRKYRAVATALAADLRALPRRDVLRLLPEQAHLLLPLRAGERRAAARRAFAAVARLAGAATVYTAVRELAWTEGRHRKLVARPEE